MYFLLGFSHYIKSYRHLCQDVACFYHDHSPNMVKSRDSSYKVRKFLTLALLLH